MEQARPPVDTGDLATDAIAWFDRHARDLPWRPPAPGRHIEAPHPQPHAGWAVLVSEVMLAQTPVNRVTDAWLAWMHRWPTPADLAASSAADAIRAWGRLGYPRRALRLHAAATVITTQFGGEVPSRLDALLALPGVGSYTARAVSAFAYRQRHPVVDTNVRRLLHRAVDGQAQAAAATTNKDLERAAALLPASANRAARASAALMELGALVCTARKPRCDECPVLARCAWQRAGNPPRTAPPPRPSQRYQGTDRQVRGLLLAVLRDSTQPVPAHRLDIVWPQPVQRRRALAGLVADGLVSITHDDRYALADEGGLDSGTADLEPS